MYSRKDLPPPTPPRPELAVQSLDLELPTARVDALELVMVPVEFPEPGVQPLQLPPAPQRATVPNMQLLAARPHVELAVNRQIEPVDQAGPPPAPMALPVPHFYRPRFLAGGDWVDALARSAPPVVPFPVRWCVPTLDETTRRKIEELQALDGRDIDRVLSGHLIGGRGNGITLLKRDDRSKTQLIKYEIIFRLPVQSSDRRA